MGQVVVTKVIEILVLGVLLGWLKTPDELIPVDLDIEPVFVRRQVDLVHLRRSAKLGVRPKKTILGTKLGQFGIDSGVII